MADGRDDFPLEEEVITLTDEDGQDHDFVFLDIIQVDEKEYAVLVPAGSEGEDDDEAVILRMETDDKGESSLVTIDDDEEWQRVVDAWDQLEDEDGEEED